ncbi:MAG: cytochrome c oxidase subunit II [Thermoleophilaceae bacterium]
MFAIGIVASIVGIVIGLAIDWFPPQASVEAQTVDLLYDVTLVIAVPIFVIVMSVVIYSVVRYRAAPGDLRDAEPVHGNTRLEVIWVLIPFVIVTALAIYSWIGLESIEAQQPNPIRVNVIAQQFAWRFEYPAEGGAPAKQTTNLVLPINRPVEFKLNSEDVIHSFWVPAFRLKSDVVPGIETRLRATPNRQGAWAVVCTELCGIGHSTMRQSARVVGATEFAAWRGAGPDSVTAARDEQAAGRRLFGGAGCAGCHALADAGAVAATGPPLGGLAEVAPSRAPGVPFEEYVRRSIVDPKNVVVPGYSPEGMPANYGQQLSPREVDTLVNYLVRASQKTGGRPQ